MKKSTVALGLLASTVTYQASAAEGPVPRGVPHLDHVFVIMMENHGYSQIINNPNAPFINKYAKSANLATNYFAIAHPSLTNYLEIVGGSNFGVLTDNYPDWHNATCTTNLASGTTATDIPASPNICPIAGIGIDAATPAFDFTNETQGPPGEVNIDGVQSIPAARDTVGKTIADQLAAAASQLEELPGRPAAQRRGPASTSATASSRTTPTSARSCRSSTRRSPRTGSSRSTPSSTIRSSYFKSVQEGTTRTTASATSSPSTGRTASSPTSASGNVPDVLVHRSEPVQRSAWPRKRRPVLQLRPQRRRLAGGPEPGADLPGRRDRPDAGDGHPRLAGLA